MKAIFLITVFILSVACTTKPKNIDPIKINLTKVNTPNLNKIQQAEKEDLELNKLVTNYCAPQGYNDLDKETIYNVNKFISSKKYNKIIYLYYILNNLEINSIKLKYAINTFIKKEENNSLPLYLAACYYLKKKDYDKCILMFDKVNKINNFDIYDSELREIIFDTSFKETKNKKISILKTILAVNVEMGMSFRNKEWRALLAKGLISKSSYKLLGEKFEKSSSIIIYKLIACCMQKDAADFESKEFFNNKNRYSFYLDLAEKYYDIYEWADDLIYLVDLLKIGEYGALLNVNVRLKAKSGEN